MAHRVLVAIGTITASSTNIPTNSWVQLPIFDNTGVSIVSGKLPLYGEGISSVQITSTVANAPIALGYATNVGVTTFNYAMAQQPDEFVCMFTPGQIPAVRSLTGAALTTGTYNVFFYA